MTVKPGFTHFSLPKVNRPFPPLDGSDLEEEEWTVKPKKKKIWRDIDEPYCITMNKSTGDIQLYHE